MRLLLEAADPKVVANNNNSNEAQTQRKKVDLAEFICFVLFKSCEKTHF